MPAALKTAIDRWRAATLRTKGIIAGLTAGLLLAAGGVAFAITAAAGGDSSPEAEAIAPSPTHTTEPSATAVPTPSLEQVKAFLDAIAPTPVPDRSDVGGARANNPTSGTAPGGTYVPPRSTGTGPGPITRTDMSLSIPVLGVRASVYARTVGTNGQMGNPAGAWDVIWYDFSQNWGPGFGGYPGQPGANAVLAGHVDYIGVGPAVFWAVRNLQAGDQIVINTSNGSYTYAVQWSRWTGPYDDFTGYVASAGQDALTLVTCIGGFSGGHYTNRLVVRAVRI